MSVAQSMLGRIGRDLPLAEGRNTGQTPDGFDWSVSISADGKGDDGVTGSLTGYGVVVTVAWREGGQERIVSLRSIRLGRQG
jgi:hypothetical protein